MKKNQAKHDDAAARQKLAAFYRGLRRHHPELARTLFVRMRAAMKRLKRNIVANLYETR